MAKERIFKFKEFHVHHEINAMKVCTEACILGAFAPVEGKKMVLDIGTGTGLLALMAAQRSQASIIGIELVQQFSDEATLNVNQSPWKDSITIRNDSIEEFAVKTTEKFDFILSNPPFYTHQLTSPDEGKNIAWHSLSFDRDNFMSLIEKILLPEGQICLLLPLPETEFYTQKASESSLFPSLQLLIKNRPDSVPFRAITIFEKKPTENRILKELVIYNEGTQYSDEFIRLLQPYYTIFE